MANSDNMHPWLVVKFQMAASKGDWKEEEADDGGDGEFEKQMVDGFITQ